MNNKEINAYIDDCIHNKLYAKNHQYEYETNFYFKNRHAGLAGIEAEQSAGLVLNSIRQLRVWRKMEKLILTNLIK